MTGTGRPLTPDQLYLVLQRMVRVEGLSWEHPILITVKDTQVSRLTGQ
ncbi:hypothetical protein ACFWBB_38615 [Streptomyces sp. NPDC060000]